jgi:hypothetical protein
LLFGRTERVFFIGTIAAVVVLTRLRISRIVWIIASALVEIEILKMVVKILTGAIGMLGETVPKMALASKVNDHHLLQP